MSQFDFTTIKPTRTTSSETKEEDRVPHQIGFDMVHQAKITDYIKRQATFEQNFHKTYTVIQKYCTEQLQNAIEGIDDYETRIRDNLIKLLETIKIVMYEPKRSKYPYSSITEAFKRRINVKHLIEWRKWAKQGKEALATHSTCWERFLGKHIEKIDAYKGLTYTDDKKKLKEKDFEKLRAYLTISNADKAKYDSLINGLSSYFTMNNDQYPKTVPAALSITKQHKHDDYNNHKKDNFSSEYCQLQNDGSAIRKNANTKNT